MAFATNNLIALTQVSKPQGPAPKMKNIYTHSGLEFGFLELDGLQLSLKLETFLASMLSIDLLICFMKIMVH